MEYIKYINLHTHTDYSNLRFLDSINKINDLIDYAYEIKLGGLAITDHENLCAHIDAQKHLSKRQKENPEDEDWKNFKLLLGNEIYLCRNGLTEESFIKGEDDFYHFILIALDEIGHRQLRELSTKAFKQSWFRNMRRVPTYYLDIEEIIGSNPGHIWASTACLGGLLPQLILKDKKEEINSFLDWCVKTFNNKFSLEMQPSNQPEQKTVNNEILSLSKSYNIPYIITTDAHYLKAEDRNIHKAYLTSKRAERETDTFYASTYLMSAEEIQNYMKSYISIEDINQGLSNTYIISNLSTNYSLLKELVLPYIPKVLLPRPVVPLLEQFPYLYKFYNSEKISDQQLSYRILNFIKNNYDANTERIEEELKSLEESSIKMKKDWSRYLLQVADYIQIYWNEGDTIVGPGRGSGVSFYINYILGITQVDPTKEKVILKPWRFLNPERASVLDIDIDIQSNRRDKCIRALKNNYGEFKVIEVCTFGTEKAKSAIRTACRGLGIDIDQATYLSSFIQRDRGLQRSLKQTFYGDEENEMSPNTQFVSLMTEKYPQVWEVAQRIEGLVNRIGKHAGGVVIVDEEFTERAAIMTTNKDEFVSQYELHTLEDLGLIKIDLLAVEALDRIRACLDLLIQGNYIQKEATLFETYQKTIGVYNLERENIKMWEMVWENKIISLFQMEQSSGIQAIQLTKPYSIEDLSTINSVMRLMPSEKGAEQPLNKYARFKENSDFWEEELNRAKLNFEEKKIIRHYLSYEFGICSMQEDVMMLVQVPEIGGFNLAWADKLRKAIAKKSPKDYEQCQKEFFNNMEEKNLSQNLCHYVWDVLVQTQRGYSFSLPHTLAYSIIALQQMNLAYKYPIIFWNCANIIADSVGIDLINGNTNENLNLEDSIINEDEDEDEEIDEKVKATTVNYGKIARAIGRMKNYDVLIQLPDINTSTLTFFPNAKENCIYYGLKGISKINDKVALNIINNRPYTSLEDFLSKVKVNKPQIINLIKAGAFDNIEKELSRKEIMEKYLYSISETKNRLTLQNVQMLIGYELLSEEVSFQVKVFNFNKYIKKNKNLKNYALDRAAYNFYEKHFDIDLLMFENFSENIIATIDQKVWEKIYQKEMNIMRDYIKKNEKELLSKLNFILTDNLRTKYAQGNLSKWEMDSVSFYYHEHELSKIQRDIYEISNFFTLDEEPVEEYTFQTQTGYNVSIYQLCRIAGTVLDKDKEKHIVNILTPDGVVTIKIWDSQFSKYDKQISELQENGKKKVIEKSWFSRGNKLIFTGIKKGSNFIPKIYKKSKWKDPILLITNIDENGLIETKNTREGE